MNVRELYGSLLSHLLCYYTEKIKPKVVVEIGCGKGYMLSFLARKFRNVYFIGVDPNAEKIDLPNVTIIRKFFEDVNLKIKADLIYSFNTIHLVNNLEKFVRKMYEVLNGKGTCIIGWNVAGYDLNGNLY